MQRIRIKGCLRKCCVVALDKEGIIRLPFYLSVLDDFLYSLTNEQYVVEMRLLTLHFSVVEQLVL